MYIFGTYIHTNTLKNTHVYRRDSFCDSVVKYDTIHTDTLTCTCTHLLRLLMIYRNRRGKFSTNLGPFGRIRQVQNTTSCHIFGTINSR